VNEVSAVARRPLTTTEDQSATFIELFFDLVFVYAVTQTVTWCTRIFPGPGWDAR
jgi:low temperature requirement protein LtrA